MEAPIVAAGTRCVCRQGRYQRAVTRTEASVLTVLICWACGRSGDRVKPAPVKKLRDIATQRMRHGATHLGISEQEYRAHVERGLKWCSYQHHGWRPVGEFGPHSRRPDGLDTVCLDCGRTAARLRMRAKREAAWQARNGTAS